MLIWPNHRASVCVLESEKQRKRVCVCVCIYCVCGQWDACVCASWWSSASLPSCTKHFWGRERERERLPSWGTANEFLMSMANERKREQERETDVCTCLRALMLPCFLSFLFISLCLSLCPSWKIFFRRMARSQCIIMHDAAGGARARQRHTSPSHMHRTGYRHTTSASAYTLSLVGMSQPKCTIHI